MKTIKIILLFLLLGCNQRPASPSKNKIKSEIQEADSALYKISEWEMSIYTSKYKIVKFRLFNTNSGAAIDGTPELIMIDGKIPEGTNRIDNNHPDDKSGFSCDSSYQFISDTLKIAFAIESATANRMDLTIYSSASVAFKNGDYTLVRANR